MHLHSLSSSLIRRALPGLLCVATLAACERGNDLSRLSGRQLRLTMRSNQGDMMAVLEQDLPEAGCLQLHPDVVATLDGIPLSVYPGSVALDPDRCFNAPPVFTARLDTELFFGAPRNAVLEIRDDEERITAEFTNYFGRHDFALLDPIPVVKPGQEVVLQWDPPTDNLSHLVAVSLNGEEVPATPEGSRVRFTVPTDFPSGRVRVSRILKFSSDSLIPAERCEGVALCTADTWFMGVPIQLDIQP